jgi:hypothetical protein
MNNPFKFETFLPKKELLPKNLMIGLLALLGSSTMAFSKGNESVLKNAEKQIESMDDSHRRDFVKNIYLQIDGGFLQDSAQSGASTETEEDWINEIDYEAEGKIKMLTISKTVASFPDSDDSLGVTKQQLSALVDGAKKLFIDQSKKTEKVLFPEADSTDLENGINEVNVDLTFIDVDGSGSPDVLQVDMQDVFSFAVALADKKEFQQKAQEFGIGKKEVSKRLHDTVEKIQKENGLVLITDKKLVDEINNKYATYMKLLRDDMKENGDIE